jgi:hypothetical protein
MEEGERLELTLVLCCLREQILELPALEADGVAQVVECLPSKYEILSLNPVL